MLSSPEILKLVERFLVPLKFPRIARVKVALNNEFVFPQCKSIMMVLENFPKVRQHVVNKGHAF